jgi:flavin reductase (DIM6/NTAB) family NADH-FMN oxidoreductase RutF
MPISSDSYKDCLRHFPSGVTIVTIRTGEKNHGLTVSAFASVSTDPPQIMIAIDHRHQAHSLLGNADAVFAVSILGLDQEHLSDRFAWVTEEDRFLVGDWETALTGAPVLTDSLAWLDCTIAARFSAGTHHIYIGEVQASKVPRPDGAPLVYWNRGYRKLGLETED